MRIRLGALLAAACALALPGFSPAYENFHVAVYCRAQEVQKMADPRWLAESWAAVSREVHVDKVYLETHRDRLLVDDATLEAAKQFFAAHGVAVAGGITFTVSEPNRFETFSYSNPEHRKAVQQIAEHTARHFDEIILDDFFFTSTKSAYDVQAMQKMDTAARSWTGYRLAVMQDAARNLVIGPAKRANPRARVIIKYPNWYDHFPALGFDLARGPQLFDGIYTGTETRDAVRSAQHLQPYLGYNIMRYFQNIAPGRNGGGWVDTGGATYYDRYAEQLWMTLFARAAPEITLFDIRQMLYPLDAKKSSPRQPMPTSFSFEEVVRPVQGADGRSFTPAHYARVAGVSFEAVDGLLGKLGKPIGVKSYKPYNSQGAEDFLQNFIGMAGVPVEMVPAFPADEPVVLLTAQAAADPDILHLIEAQLERGKDVVITSGLLRELQGRGLRRIAELEDSGRVAQVSQFIVGRGAPVSIPAPMLIPQITYRTNDSWELVSAVAGDNGWPVLHDADYLDGQLQVLTIPENFSDLSNYPQPVLDAIRRVIGAALPVKLEAPGKVSLFVYDNGTFIVHNFRDEPVNAAVSLRAGATLSDLATGEKLATTARAQAARFGAPAVQSAAARFALAPHSFRAFRIE
jgi:hypothetical protein